MNIFRIFFIVFFRIFFIIFSEYLSECLDPRQVNLTFSKRRGHQLTPPTRSQLPILGLANLECWSKAQQFIITSVDTIIIFFVYGSILSIQKRIASSIALKDTWWFSTTPMRWDGQIELNVMWYALIWFHFHTICASLEWAVNHLHCLWNVWPSGNEMVFIPP